MNGMGVEEVTKPKEVEDHDARNLQELGYRQQLDVRFRLSRETAVELALIF